MDRDQINQVAHLPPSGRAMGLVHGKVNRVLEKTDNRCQPPIPAV
jgi:hypothetical protein